MSISCLIVSFLNKWFFLSDDDFFDYKRIFDFLKTTIYEKYEFIFWSLK